MALVPYAASGASESSSVLSRANNVAGDLLDSPVTKIGGRALVGVAVASDIFDVATAPPGQKVHAAVHDERLAGVVVRGTWSGHAAGRARPRRAPVSGLRSRVLQHGDAVGVHAPMRMKICREHWPPSCASKVAGRRLMRCPTDRISTCSADWPHTWG
jgi:hypothetical protein